MARFEIRKCHCCGEEKLIDWATFFPMPEKIYDGVCAECAEILAERTKELYKDMEGVEWA